MLFLSVAFSLLLLFQFNVNQARTNVNKVIDKEIKACPKPNLVSSCLEKNVEYPLTAEDRQALEKANLVVKTERCNSNSVLTCLSTDRQSLIGAGTYGLVVRGRSHSVPFPLAVKFLKLPNKFDLVSFNVQGRYNRIDLSSLKNNRGSETGLREAVALRLLTEYEVPSVPKYFTDFQTSSYRVLAMEFLDGYEELSKTIDQLSSKQLLMISCHIAATICNFDRLGLGHDDLHEKNLLINRRNLQQIYVIDFGGAQFHGHLTSAGNLLKQPINLLGHLRRLVKEDLIDRIQSAEKKSSGQFCEQMQKPTKYEYETLFGKYWKLSETKKKFFKCTLTS